MRIGTDAPGEDVSRVPGTVTETVYMGSSTHYQVDIGGGEEVTVYQQNASGSTLVAQRGEAVWLSWRPEHSFALSS